MTELQNFYASIAATSADDGRLGEFEVVDPATGGPRTVVIPSA
jgi:hypothetical protein